MNKIINDTIKIFNANKSILFDAFKTDETDFEFDYNKLIKVIESYKNKKINSNEIGVICYTDGNPYTTVHLCVQSMLCNSVILICNQNNMNNLNKVIVDIFKEVSDNPPRLETRITADKLYLFTENKRDKIIVYNDKNRYEKIKSFGIPVIYKEI